MNKTDLTFAQRQILKGQIDHEVCLPGEEWRRDIYMGGYADNIEKLVRLGLLEKRPHMVKQINGAFGHEYRTTEKGRKLMQNVELTHEEATAMINALRNLVDEMRVSWQPRDDAITNEDRVINRAWLVMFEKPAFPADIAKAFPVLSGEQHLYPDPVDLDDLTAALKKWNG